MKIKKSLYDNINISDFFSVVAGNHWIKDKDGIYLWVNDEFLETYGLDNEKDIVGKTDFDLPWEETANVLVENDNAVLKSGKKTLYVEETKLPSGGCLFLAIIKNILKDKDGQVFGTVGNSIDVTELKETQKDLKDALKVAEHAEQRRKEFVRNQAHDINTSIAGIVYAAYEIEATDSIKEVHGVSPRIRLCASRLQEYNKSLLRDLAWIEGEGRVINQRTDIREILTKLYDLNVLAAEAKNITLTINKVSEKVPLYFVADELVIFQCLQNLVTNAIKFTQKGNVTIRLKLLEVRNDGVALVAFHIKDTGRGISHESTRYIFDDYYKALPSNQPDKLSGQQADEDKGRGLGLTLSKKQAEAMGGELDLAWSEVNKGSEFVLTLPLKVALNQEKVGS